MARATGSTIVSEAVTRIAWLSTPKKHRGKGQREDSEWEQIIEEASKIGKKYEGNAWCKQFLIQMISIIEEEDTEIRAKREELEKAA